MDGEGAGDGRGRRIQAGSRRIRPDPGAGGVGRSAAAVARGPATQGDGGGSPAARARRRRGQVACEANGGEGERAAERGTRGLRSSGPVGAEEGRARAGAGLDGARERRERRRHMARREWMWAEQQLRWRLVIGPGEVAAAADIVRRRGTKCPAARGGVLGFHPRIFRRVTHIYR